MGTPRRPSRGTPRCATAAVAGLALAALTACSPPANPTPAWSTPAAAEPALTVEVNQSRDQYGRHGIELLITNSTDSPVTVSDARLSTSLFQQDIRWDSAGGVVVVPPHQAKIRTAMLPTAACPEPGRPTSSGPAAVATATLTLPAADATAPATVPPTTAPTPTSIALEATDPLGILARNNAELCLSAAAAAVADLALAPDLAVAPDLRTAVVHLLVDPAGGARGSGRLTLERFEGTTLLAEASADPWPVDTVVRAGAAPFVMNLRLRPARCDAHAVAEDKVGTLLPVRVAVGMRSGQLKLVAGATLRGQLYDFVTKACAAG
ncbi:hypothetical protein ACRB8A_10475 [Arthrobacter sp. G.S.26]|uniref:hypothetical protein n=1 Tax=Arthrobacter sp. G.S.26 TaxID=3433706 RepID=UPI003D778907